MRAEFEITRRKTHGRIRSFLVGKPIKIPDSIQRLDLRYNFVGKTILDQNEAKKLHEALAGVDAAAANFREGINPRNEVVLAIFGNVDSVPSPESQSNERKKAIAKANILIKNLGLAQYVEISQGGTKRPTTLIAREGYKLTEETTEGELFEGGTGVVRIEMAIEENRFRNKN